MAATMQSVRETLEMVEPEYQRAASALGASALPVLEQLVNGHDVLAPRAVCLASLIGGAGAERILVEAIKSPVLNVRIQAAGAARFLSGDGAARVLLTALSDVDASVRLVALKSARNLRAVPAGLVGRIQALAASDSDAFVRSASAALLSQ
jgi:hypothetical protein